jgi:hypothetical protein
MNTPNTTDLTPALFTLKEIQHLRKIARDAESELARRYLEAGLQRAVELRTKRQAAKDTK